MSGPVARSEAPFRLAMTTIGWLADLLSLRRSAVLCLHGVTDASTRILPNGRMSVSAGFLSSLIGDLISRGVDLVSAAEAVERVHAGVGRPCVAFTLDDGYRDNFTVAYPVFKAHRVPFTVFLTTGLLDRTHPMWWHILENLIWANDSILCDEKRLATADEASKLAVYGMLDARFRAMNPAEVCAFVEELVSCNRSEIGRDDIYGLALDWDMVREMAASGLATFGGHTVTHQPLSRLGEAELRAEIASNRARISKATGVPTELFAYPFGQPHEVGPLAPRIVEEAGYTLGFTTQSRVLTPPDILQRFALPRIMIARKAQSSAIVRAYLSGIPAALKRA